MPLIPSDVKTLIISLTIGSIVGLVLGFLVAYPILKTLNQPSVAVENQDVCFRIKLADLEEILKAEEQDNPRT